MCLHRLLFAFVVLSGLNSLATTPIIAQESHHTGRPEWRSFDSRDTHAGEITYSSSINSKGLVYATNEAGLLSYDGVSWRLLPHTPQSRGITHIVELDLLELDLSELNREPWPKGSWLTGGANGLGLYTPDDKGHLNWSAIDMPGSPGDSQTEPRPTVQNLMTVGNVIYIVSDAGVYTFGPDGVAKVYEYILSGVPTGFAYKHDDGIVFEVENGLLHLTEERYSALTLPPRWLELTPVSVLEDANFGQLLVTQRSGVFVLQTSGSGITLSPLWDELPAPLDTSTVLTAAVTQNGGLIFGTDNGALLHFNLSGKLVSRLDNRAGLHAGPIRSLSTGLAGDVFAFFDGGAVWFNTKDPLRVWDIINGLEKPVTAVAVDSDRVYAGTTAGLYQSVSNGRMRIIPELGEVPIRSLNLFKRSSMRDHTSLIVGTARGLIDYYESRVTTLFEDQPTAVFVSRTQPSRLAAGFGTQAYLFDFDQGEWTEVGPIGTQFKSVISDFTETSDGDLLIVLSDGTLMAFAADDWLNSGNLERAKPLWAQEFPRHMGFDATPHFSEMPDAIRLFMTGAVLQWDYKSERFQTDTTLATEFSRVSYPEFLNQEFPRWYAARQTAQALWLQTSIGSYAVPAIAPETQHETLPSLIALPAATRGTASSSAIEFDARTDRVLFATPEGLTSYPRQFLMAEQVKSPLPALHIRKIMVDGQTFYHGDGPQPQITVKSTNGEVLVHLAVLDWQIGCGDEGVTLKRNTSENINVNVAPDCTATFAIEDFESQKSPPNFSLVVDGQTVTQDVRLNIKVSRPVISSPLLPLIMGIAAGFWVLFNRLSVKPSRPESIQRYIALTSGLFILLAAAQAGGIIIAPGSVLSAMALWLGALFIAFIVPVFAKIMLHVSDRS
jgi:hypothetical protein